jgi:hypothetical protein
MNKKSLIVLCCLTAVFAAPLFAQDYDEIELTRQMIQTDRQAIITQAMAFTPEESKAFWPVYRQYRGEMSKIGDRWVSLVSEYAQNFENLSDELAAKMLDDYLKIEKDRVSLRTKYVKDFRKILPTKKVTKFYQIENKLDAIIDFDLAGQIPLVK